MQLNKKKVLSIVGIVTVALLGAIIIYMSYTRASYNKDLKASLYNMYDMYDNLRTANGELQTQYDKNKELLITQSNRAVALQKQNTILQNKLKAMQAADKEADKPVVKETPEDKEEETKEAEDKEEETKEAEEIKTESEPEQPSVAVPLSKELQDYTYTTCKEYGIVDDYELILAVMKTESDFNASLISSTNDYGLMQINECNHAWLRDELGITDFLNPKQNIKAGIHMLSSYLQDYSNSNQALMAYNMGTSGMQKAWSRGTVSTNYTDKVNNALSTIK